MASNDEVVLSIPNVQCPSCMQALVLNQDKLIHKFSKGQREKMYGGGYSVSSVNGYSPEPHYEDVKSERPENVFAVMSCENGRCEQYNKIKVLRIPRLSAPGVRVEL